MCDVCEHDYDDPADRLENSYSELSRVEFPWP